MDDAQTPRTYLVVLDGSPEARVALRFAARRAAKTGGRVEMLAIVEPPEFVQWGGVQAALEEEARLHAEALLHQAAGEIIEELGLKPDLTVRQGERVKAVRALLAALGSKTGTAYCCLDTKDLSPPVALGVPPLKISEGSPLKNFQHYCFACHRGNPSKRLNFMAGANEAEVLEHLKAKSEIRDALDWDRYRGTDKANKMMPPADSHQRAMLEADVAKNPALLEDMRKVVPSLFDF